MARFNKVIVGIVVSILLSSGGAKSEVSGNVVCSQSSCKIEKLRLSGPITANSFQELKRIVGDAKNRTTVAGSNGLSGTTINLNSPGGSVDYSLAIGRLLRSERMTAIVSPGNSCVSACVFVYAGAVARFGSSPAARLSIHQPYFDFEKTSASADDVRMQYAKLRGDIGSYLREMNVSEQLAEDMLRIGPSSVRFLTAKEQDRYGLVILDPVEREVWAIEETKRLGISRSEHIRRETFSQRLRSSRGRRVPSANYGNWKKS